MWGGGGGGARGMIINTRNGASYNIRLLIYDDGVRSVEMKRRLREKLLCTVYI